MNSRLGWARVQCKMRGVVLPPLTSRIGREATYLWGEVIDREVVAQMQQVTHFLPAVTYVMSGLPAAVPFPARHALLEPYVKELYASTDYSRYTPEKMRASLVEQAAELRKEAGYEQALAAIATLDQLG